MAHPTERAIEDGRSARPWPFVGRDDELERLLAARREPGCTGAVISGPAGVGKSRLARELLVRAREAGAAVEWVQATRMAATIPLGAFAELVPEGARSDDRLQLLRGSLEALRERAAGRPLVVGVDDAQLLDAASAALVLHLAGTGTAFVVATVRTGERPPDSIVALWKDAGAARLELQLLSEEETGALVEAALDGPIEERVRDWAYATSEGNALYVRELVASALQTGALVREGAWWVLKRRPPVGSALVELISDRLAELTEPERAALALVALGEPLPLDVVLALAGAEPLSAVEARQLIAVDPPVAGGAVRVAHPLYGEVVRGALSTLRAMELRRRLAAALQERGLDSPGEALRVATWLHEAGAPVDTELLMRAAWQATQYGDPALGADLARRALDAGGGFPAALQLARALIVDKRFDEAEALLATLEDEVPDRWAALGYIWERGVNVLCWGLKRPDEARALIERAMGWEGGTPDWHRLLAPMRLTVTALTDGWHALVALGEEILADPALDPEGRRQLTYGQAGGLFFVGRTAEAMALAEEVEVRVPLRDDFDDQTLIIQAAIRIESGRDWDGLQERLERLEADARRHDDRAAAATTAMMLAGLGVQRGRPAGNRRWAHEAVARLERRDRAGLLPTALAITAMLSRVAGDAEACTAAAARMERELGGEEPLINQLPYVISARACAALAGGDPGRAQEILVDGVQRFPEGPGYRVWFRFEAVRAGADPRAHAQAIAQAAERTDAPLAAAQARHVVALAAGDGDALLAVSADLEALGALLWAAESAAGAASALRAAGREDAARRAAARAHELRERCGAAATPPLEAAGAQADGLTAREREVVALAAAGASNAEIARRLVLSVRTVETHLYRAMQKLGVRSRGELR